MQISAVLARYRHRALPNASLMTWAKTAAICRVSAAGHWSRLVQGGPCAAGPPCHPGAGPFTSRARLVIAPRGRRLLAGGAGQLEWGWGGVGRGGRGVIGGEGRGRGGSVILIE